MSLRSTHETSEKLEQEGVWQDVDINDHNSKPIRIKISRMGRSNKKYTALLDKVMKPHQAALANDAMPPMLARRLLMSVFIDTILLDWDNLPKSELTGNSEDTESLDFSRENALALFNAEGMSGVYDDWRERAGKAATFREAQLEQNAGN